MKVLIEFESTPEAVDSRANRAPQPLLSVAIFPSKFDSGVCDGTARLLIGDMGQASDGGSAAIGREAMQKASSGRPFDADQARLYAQPGMTLQTQRTPVGVSDGGRCALATALFRTR